MKLKEIREAKGISQRQAALALNLSPTVYGRYENGIREPSNAMLLVIADYFGVTVDELLGRDTTVDTTFEDEAIAIRERLRRDPSYRMLFDAADNAKPDHLRAAAAGIRTVPLLSVLRPLLVDRVGLILLTATGGMMTDTAFRRCWESYLLHLSRAAGHPVSIRPHDLRHTYCTMLRDSGVDMHQAMIWMGHADEKMILRVYDHVTDTRTKNSVDQVEKTLLKVQNEVQTENVPHETQQ